MMNNALDRIKGMARMSKDEAQADDSRGKANRPRVMPDVVRMLATEILDGRRASGSPLPREADLCAEYGVSRTVIREAMKILAAKGLVEIRPRVGTTVCGAENWNIIDPQVIEWHTPEMLDSRLLDAILETRRAVEPFAAKLAATRATLQEIADLEEAWRGMEQGAADIELFSRSDIAFHRILYAASHNPVFHQIGNLIDAALRAALETTAALPPEQRASAAKLHYDVVEALRLRDPKKARRATNALLDLAASDLAAVKDRHKAKGASKGRA